MPSTRFPGCPGLLTVVTVFALLTSSALAGDDSAARSALAEARKRQEALPGYVEHVISTTPFMPDAAPAVASTVGAQLKTAAIDAVRDSLPAGPTKALAAGETVDTALSVVEAKGSNGNSDTLPPETAGSEREIGTIQHRGKITRQVLFNGYCEMVDAEGQRAIRYNLSNQIAALRTLKNNTLTGEGLAEVRQVRTTIRDISSNLRQFGGVGVAFDAMAIFDQVTDLLALARDAKAMNQPLAMLEKMSGTWRIESAPLKPTYTYPIKVSAVEQLPDATFAGAPAHVYREQCVLEGLPAPRASAADDGDPPRRAQIERTTWVRIADGLPIRTEFAPPGGPKQAMNYEYPENIEIDLPPGLTVAPGNENVSGASTPPSGQITAGNREKPPALTLTCTADYELFSGVSSDHGKIHVVLAATELKLQDDGSYSGTGDLKLTGRIDLADHHVPIFGADRALYTEVDCTNPAQLVASTDASDASIVHVQITPEPAVTAGTLVYKSGKRRQHYPTTGIDLWGRLMANRPASVGREIVVKDSLISGAKVDATTTILVRYPEESKP
jgi:hypothetical protein